MTRACSGGRQVAEGAYAPRIDHVDFGLVLGDDGKRFRTRSGEVVRLVDLLDEAKRRCREQLVQRNVDMTPEEMEHAAEALGYGAVKYADLHQNRKSDYTFSFDRMLDLKGNTAVYLLYAHARIASIVRKSETDVVAAVKGGATLQLEEPTEQALALALAEFPEVVEDLLDNLTPSTLCEYLYTLSSKFNEFYVACKVLGSEQQVRPRVQRRAVFAVPGVTAVADSVGAAGEPPGAVRGDSGRDAPELCAAGHHAALPHLSCVHRSLPNAWVNIVTAMASPTRTLVMQRPLSARRPPYPAPATVPSRCSPPPCASQRASPPPPFPAARARCRRLWRGETSRTAALGTPGTPGCRMMRLWRRSPGPGLLPPDKRQTHSRSPQS